MSSRPGTPVEIRLSYTRIDTINPRENSRLAAAHQPGPSTVRGTECLSAPSLAQIFGWYNQWAFTTFPSGDGQVKKSTGQRCRMADPGTFSAWKGFLVMTGTAPRDRWRC